MNEEFDIINCKENQESSKNLLSLFESGTAVLFVGSGISRRLGYPSWEGVLQDLGALVQNAKVRELAEEMIKKEQLLHAAEIIKTHLPEGLYNSKFEEIFKHKNPSHDEFHQTLVRLKVKGFITTNYDPVIEAALRAMQDRYFDCTAMISETTKKDIRKVFKSLANINWNQRMHLYLHGKFNYPLTFILSYGDYVKKYDGIDIKKSSTYKALLTGKINIDAFESKMQIKDYALRTLHYKTVYLLMATQRIIYCGYGLRDPYLKKITDDIQRDFDPAYDDYHFALVSSNESKNWNRSDYLRWREEWSLKGIDIVFFQDNDKFKGIEDFVGNLSPESFIGSLPKPELGMGRHEQDTQVEPSGDPNINKVLISKARKAAQELKRK